MSQRSSACSFPAPHTHRWELEPYGPYNEVFATGGPHIQKHLLNGTSSVRANTPWPMLLWSKKTFLDGQTKAAEDLLVLVQVVFRRARVTVVLCHVQYDDLYQKTTESPFFDTAKIYPRFHLTKGTGLRDAFDSCAPNEMSLFAVVKLRFDFFPKGYNLAAVTRLRMRAQVGRGRMKRYFHALKAWPKIFPVK